MTTTEMAHEALSRATNPMGSTRNYVAILAGFEAKGIPADDIRPRENVLTFWAWKAVGRRVKRGEHGVHVCTWIPLSKNIEQADERTGETVTVKKQLGRKPRTAVVFHISQTEPIPGWTPADCD
jgi:antirestriction protein ArdC